MNLPTSSKKKDGARAGRRRRQRAATPTQPALFANTAAASPRGEVEFYGYHNAATGWVFCGWSTLLRLDAESPRNFVARFAGKEIADTGTVVPYERADLTEQGTGFILFLPSAVNGAEPLSSLSLLFAETTEDIGVANAECLPFNRLSRQLHPILARDAVAERGPNLVARLRSPAAAPAAEPGKPGDLTVSRAAPQPPSISAELLFDADWYRTIVDTSADDAYRHYCSVGFRQGLPPSPLFDVEFYQRRFPRQDFTRINPLEHYLATPVSHRPSPHPLFLPPFYKANAKELPDHIDPFLHYLSDAGGRMRAPHPLFDPEFYLRENPDVTAAGISPLQHYLLFGIREGREPHPLFDTDWYREQLGGDDKDALAPLTHYVEQGAAGGLSPHPLFQTSWYLRQTQDLAASADPMLHYLQEGSAAGLSPHPLFDPPWYRRTQAALDAGADALCHFVVHGDPQNLDPHPLFDTSWYRAQYLDVAAQRVNALRHYVLHGGKELREPHPLFDTAWYLAQAGGWVANPLLHYLERGAAAGLSPHPVFDPQWYLTQTRDPNAALCPLRHYVETGAAAALSPHPLFDATWYLRQTRDPGARACPLRHYLATGSAEGLSPHPLFDPRWYRLSQMGAADDEEPLCHFLRSGDREGLDPNPLFSTGWYRQRYPDVAGGAVNAVCHYIVQGGREGRDTHPTFSHDGYLRNSPECQRSGQLPLVHALSRTPQTSTWRPEISDDAVWQHLPSHSWQAQASVASSYAPARRAIAAFLTEEFDDDAARRVMDYFEVVTRLEALELETAGRKEMLSALVARMQHLAESANDDRAIEASVIVPVYNHIEYTIACVLALLEHKSRRRFEIIVGNDVSTDETIHVFNEVGGIVKCVTPELNGGFLRNCNFAARYARGRYLVLLNNDAFVLDQWLDNLLLPFERFTNVGLVGSKLLNADGTLQEAGGIIWRDGSGWNFGRGRDATLPEFNYLKDVDYVSGASIAVPKRLWDELGGFDPRFIPAYAEDADMAFALRSKGLRTLYTPFSMVIHHEGVSHGRDVTVGLKAYQLENKTKFVDKWQGTLGSEQFDDAQHVFLARDRSRFRRHILVIDHYIPQFDRDAGSRTLFEYCRLFVDGGLQVSFWPDNLYRDKDYIRTLQEIGVEVLYGPQLVDKFADWMQENGADIDYAFISRPHIGIKYIDQIKRYSSAKILFYGHDLHHARLEREFQITKDANLHKEIEYWRDVESKMWRQSDTVYYPAEDEVETVTNAFRGKDAKTLSIYIYSDAEISATRRLIARASVETPTIMFVAGFRHRPNVDAALWLVDEVLPEIRKHIPDVILVMAGSSPPAEVTALQSDGIIVTGYVSDALLQRLYRTTSVVVAPLRFGGGVKGKIIEALRFGVPVATTTAGSQGLPGAEAYLEIGDTAPAFAQAVVRLLRSKGLRQTRALNGLDYIERAYSHRSVARRMAEDIPELGAIATGKRMLTY